MKTYYKFVCLLTVSMLVLASCNSMIRVEASDKLTEKEYNLTDFNSVQISNSFKVEIIQSKEYRVEVTYNEDLEDHVEVVKKGDVLKLGLSQGYYYGNYNLSAKIYMPTIESINASGASVIKFDEFDVSDLSIDLSGASKITGGVDVASDFSIESSGASLIALEGTAKNMTLDLSGASSFKGKELLIDENLTVECSGASNVKLTANGNVEADLSGASVFYCYGNGVIVKQDTSGASVIKKM